MSFNIGDRVIHKSDKRSRKMVVVAIAVKEIPPSNIHNEFVNIGGVVDGSYYCTWISGAKKGDGYFTEIEIELQP
jgi:uncharacterized protein YodC (DUF2158 family)